MPSNKKAPFTGGLWWLFFFAVVIALVVLKSKGS